VVMAMISAFPHKQQPPVERIDAGKEPAPAISVDDNLANAARTATGDAAAPSII